MSIDPAAFRRQFRSLAAELGRTGTQSLCDVLEVEHFQSGEVIVDLGGGDWILHFMSQGDVSVQLPGPTGLIEVGELHAGSVIGEVSFLDHQLHTAQVVAEGPCTAFRLSHAGMEQLRVQDPVAAANLVHAACQVLAERLRMAVGQLEQLQRPPSPDGQSSSSLLDAVRVLLGMPRAESEVASALALLPGFSELTSHERAVLDHAMWVQERPDGHRFVTQGRRTDTAYLVLEGEVAVVRKHDDVEEEVARHGRGDLFGLLALLDHQPRSASCVAVGPVRVACLQRQAYQSLRHRPAVLRPIQGAIAAQLTKDFRRVDNLLRGELQATLS